MVEWWSGGGGCEKLPENAVIFGEFSRVRTAKQSEKGRARTSRAVFGAPAENCLGETRLLNREQK